MLATATATRSSAAAITNKLSKVSNAALEYMDSLIGSHSDRSDPSTLKSRDPLYFMKLISLWEQSRHSGEVTFPVDAQIAIIRETAVVWPRYSLNLSRHQLSKCGHDVLSDDGRMDRIVGSICQALGRTNKPDGIVEIKERLLQSSSKECGARYPWSNANAAINLMNMGYEADGLRHFDSCSSKFISLLIDKKKMSHNHARSVYNRHLLDGGLPSARCYASLIRSLGRQLQNDGSASNDLPGSIEQAWAYVRLSQESAMANERIYEALLDLYIAANRVMPEKYPLTECQSIVWKEISAKSLGVSINKRRMYESLMVAYATRRYPVVAAIRENNDNLAQCLRLKRESMTEDIPITVKMYQMLFLACHPGETGRRLACNPAIIPIEMEMQSLGIMHSRFSLLTFVNIAWAGGHYTACRRVLAREQSFYGDDNWAEMAPDILGNIFRFANHGEPATVRHALDLLRDRHLLAKIFDYCGNGSKKHQQLVDSVKRCCEKFLALVNLWERIDSTRRRQTKEIILAEQFRRWRDDSHWNADQFYSVLRLMVPFLDMTRMASGLKEATIGQIYIDLLGLSRNSPEAQAISEYEKRHLEFADAIYHALLPRCMVKQEDSQLTVDQINQQLDHIYDPTGSNRRTDQKQVFNFIFQHSCAAEQKWFVRILLKHFRLGVGSFSILRLYHPRAQEFYEFCNNLHKVIHECFDPAKDPVNLKVAVMQSFTAMKLKRVLPREVPALMQNEPFWLEQKLDGARMIVHYCRGQFRYFGRNGVDQTRYYGSTGREKFSARLESLLTRKPGVWALILDGEMMEWDVETQSFTKQFTNYASTALAEGDGGQNESGGASTGKQSCFVVFDLLLINGTSLLDCALEQRFNLLTEVVQGETGTLQINQHTVGHTVEDVVDACESIMLAQGEGVCVKDPKSCYVPAARGDRWLKIKPDYYSELGEHLDLAVIGANYGSGSQTGTLNSFLCAMIVNRDTHPLKYMPLARFGTGFDSKTREELVRRLSPYFKTFNNNDPLPDWLDNGGNGGGTERRLITDLLIDHPSHAVVCELKATQWIPANDYSCGWTLRFPRFCKLRSDKLPDEVMDLSEMNLMRSRPASAGDFRLLEHNASAGDESGAMGAAKEGSSAYSSPAKRKIADLLPAHQRGIDQSVASSMAVKSKLLDGLEICVKTGDDRFSKTDLERLIIENGGTVTQSPLRSTDFVLAGHKTLQVSNIAKSGFWDIVKIQWLLDSIDQNRKIFFEPHYLHHATDKTLLQIRESMDVYGDRFDQTLGASDLKRLFDEIHLTAADVGKEENFIELIEEEYQMYPSSNLAIFRPCSVYLDCYRKVFESNSALLETSPLLLAERLVRFYGGSVVRTASNPKSQITHIVVDPSDSSRLDELRQFVLQSKPRKPRLVHFKWIMDSIEEKSLLPENLYSV